MTKLLIAVLLLCAVPGMGQPVRKMGMDTTRIWDLLPPPIQMTIVDSTIIKLTIRIDSLEAKLARAHVVEVVDTIAVPGCGYWWSSPGWYRNFTDSIPEWVFHADTCWEYTAHYEIFFEPED